LAAYALAVPAQASIKLLASGHYAQGNTKTPVRIAVVAVVFAAASAFLLMQYLGAAGIALGAAAGAYTNAFLNYAKLRSRLGSIAGPPEIRALATVGLACTVAAGGAMGVVVWRSADPVWLVAVAASAAFCLLYGAVTVALANPEARKILSTLRR